MEDKLANKSERRAVQCPKCEKAVMAKIIGEETQSIEPPDYIIKRTFVVCDVCSQPMLLRENGELLPDIEGDWDEYWEEPILLYPSREKNFGSAVPRNVRNTYAEALTCLSAGAYTAATIMARRTLEIVCSELGEDDRRTNLYTKIKNLSRSRKFSGRVSQWADGLRKVGNFAAHDPDQTFTKSQATLVVDFAEALIENCFVLEEKFRNFEQYTQSLKNKKPTTRSRSA